MYTSQSTPSKKRGGKENMNLYKVFENKKRFISVVILFFITIGLIEFVTEKYKLENDLEKKLQTKTTHILEVLKIEKEKIVKDSKKTIEILSNLDGVKKAIKDKNRDTLFNILESRYNELQSRNGFIKVLHFHLLDGTSLLRMHEKDKFGDNIAKKRETIATIHKNHKPTVAYETGLYDKNLLTLRVVEPVILDDTYIGAVEIGIDISYILESVSVQANSNINFALYAIKTKYLDKLQTEISHKTVNGSYLVLNSNDYRDEYSKYLNTNDIFSYKEKTFFSKTCNKCIENIDDISIGMMHIVLDISDDISSYNDNLIMIVVKPLVVLSILFILIWYYSKYQTILEAKIKNQIKEINQQQETILSQGKFAAMGEMIGMIAHQWRQPLNVVILNISNIQSMIHQKKVIRANLDSSIESITNNINYMNKTIDDFKDFLKVKKENIEKVDIADLVYKPKHLVESELKNTNISFRYETLIDTKQKISIDVSKFHQVVLNLYKNSIDEFKSKKIKKPFIKVNTSIQDDTLIVKIEDNAGGIPQDIIKDIFNPYFSTKGKNGTGIGLYMSKRIIEEHINGTIEVQNNEQNDGAVFIINIPYKEDISSTQNLPFGSNYKCLTWDKEKEIFIKKDNASSECYIKESADIITILDTFFIEYQINENGDIKVLLS